MSTLAPTDYRYFLQAGDAEHVRQIVAATGFFSPAEVDVAVELVEERQHKGPASGYEFVIADVQGEFLGYTCYGEIACSVGSYDLYWIAVSPHQQGQGIGRQLLQETERQVLARNGRHLYAETSSRAQYASTRKFYEQNGYEQAALLEDFYAPGDGKVIYRKILQG